MPMNCIIVDDDDITRMEVERLVSKTPFLNPLVLVWSPACAWETSMRDYAMKTKAFNFQQIKQPKIMEQKSDYIHKNPVEEGIVQYEKDYLYSSAKDYSDEKGLVKISLLWW